MQNQSDKSHSLLPARALAAISGEDAIAFLQGLITNNAEKLKQGEAIYAALLSPQGKYLHDFFLIPWQEKIFLDGEKARLPDLLKRLNMYKLRSRVTIEPMETMGVAAVWGQKPVTPEAGKLFADPRLPELGYRIIGPLAELENSFPHSGDYDRMRLELGVPDGSRDMIVDRALLLEYGFEQLHGVDFTKGCYVGQEVIARAHYRGHLKKSLYQVRAKGALPPPGTPIHAGEALAGEMRSSAGNLGLALLRIEEAAKGGLRAGELAIEAAQPSWFAH